MPAKCSRPDDASLVLRASSFQNSRSVRLRTNKACKACKASAAALRCGVATGSNVVSNELYRSHESHDSTTDWCLCKLLCTTEFWFAVTAVRLVKRGRYSVEREVYYHGTQKHGSQLCTPALMTLHAAPPPTSYGLSRTATSKISFVSSSQAESSAVTKLHCLLYCWFARCFQALPPHCPQFTRSVSTVYPPRTSNRGLKKWRCCCCCLQCSVHLPHPFALGVRSGAQGHYCCCHGDAEVVAIDLNLLLADAAFVKPEDA